MAALWSFVIPEPLRRSSAQPRLILGLAPSSGSTPILSWLRSIRAREPQSQFGRIYGNRNTKSIIFKEALEDLKDRFLGRLTVHHVLSREQQEIDLLNGRPVPWPEEWRARLQGELD